MMTLRAAVSLAVLPFLAACSSGGGEPPGDPIACAVGRAGQLDQACKAERLGSGKAAQLIIHHPDGGFRRFVLSADGKGLMPADGADEASSVVAKGVIELTIEQDHYRIPLSLLEPANDR